MNIYIKKICSGPTSILEERPDSPRNELKTARRVAWNDFGKARTSAR